MITITWHIGKLLSFLCLCLAHFSLMMHVLVIFPLLPRIYLHINRIGDAEANNN